MSKVKNAVMGVLISVFGILLTIVGWFWIPEIASTIELEFLKVIFWVGFVGTWLSAIIISPLIMIMGGSGSLKDIIKGIAVFFIGTFSSLISYWVILPMQEILDTIFHSDALTGITWVALTIFWIGTMILLPIYLCLKGSLDASEQNE